MVRGGDGERRDQPEGWYGGGNKGRGINQPRSSTVVWYDDIIDDTIYVDQPKDGLMGGMVSVKDVEHGDQPEGWYGGEYNGMGGNQPMYGTVGVEGEWTKTHMLGGEYTMTNLRVVY